MDNAQLMPLLGGALAGVVLGAGAVYFWLSSRLKQERQRLHHVDQARQQTAQQVTQARKQVEQLQRENHELRLAVRPAPRPAPAPVAEPAVDAAEAARLYAESKMQPPAPKPAARAFKDTEVLKRDE
ncbi:MAG: hypothetical protein K9J82_14515 [Methylotenera sp.]|jgi:uncharacterized membrane protein YccC|nr:hypothetical protein [Methylotenera sp.]